MRSRGQTTGLVNTLSMGILMVKTRRTGRRARRPHVFPFWLENDFMGRLGGDHRGSRNRALSSLTCLHRPARAAVVPVVAPPMPPKEKPLAEPATLHDVARLAGVSASTVSRILNGTARVTE